MIRIALRSTVLFIVWILIAEIVLQTGYRIGKGRFSWETIASHETFLIEYLKPTGDLRYLAARAGYARPGLSFDSHGFRRGSHSGSETAGNLVFLGDSVLFGHGLADSETVPSRVYDLLAESDTATPVINASLPSFSLDQLTHKYAKEIHGVYPVRAVIVHAYDPALSFYFLAGDWDVARNWYTGAARPFTGSIRRFTQTPLRYSAVFYVYWRYSGRYFVGSRTDTRYDTASVRRYTDSITGSLSRLYSQTSRGIPVVLLPVVRPQQIYRALTPLERAPIDLLNRQLQTYAAAHPGVHFLDIRPVLYEHDDSEIFMDDCCHLTPEGASILASAIVHELRRLEIVPVR